MEQNPQSDTPPDSVPPVPAPPEEPPREASPEAAPPDPAYAPAPPAQVPPAESQGPPGYQPPPPGYAQTPSGYEQPPPSYEQAPPTYGQAPPVDTALPIAEDRSRPIAVIGSIIWRAAIGILALKYASDGVNVDRNLSPDSLSYLSNRAVGFIYLGLAVYPVLTAFRRAEPRTAWVRSASMVMMFVVAFVFVIGFGEDPDGAHAIIPALVMIDALFVGRSQLRARWWEPPTWTAFLIAYLIYHRSKDLGLYPDILGEDKIATMVPLMLVGTIVCAYVFWGVAKLRKSVTGTT